MALQQTPENSSHTDRSAGPEHESNWSDLPPDLLLLISRKLTDICDFVRFRVVCKRWRSAVRASDLAPQLPWITDNSESFEEGCLRFYSLLTGKTYTINVPECAGKLVTGSAYNYVLAYTWRRHECSLFNPLTQEELLLPRARIEFPTCVPSGLHPDESFRCVCLANTHETYAAHLFYCRLGDPNWTRIRGDLFPSASGEFDNTGVALYDGMCYASDMETGSTKVIDLATGSMIYLLPRPETLLKGLTVYLVASFGEILRVCHYKKYSSKTYFVIYRLAFGNRDGNATKPCWIKIDAITDRILFLHENQSCAFRADDFPGFLGNCIYFSKHKYKEETFELSRYHLKDGKIEVLQVPMKLGPNWFVPTLS